MMAAAMKAHFVIQELSAHVGMHPRYPGQIPVPVARNRTHLKYIEVNKAGFRRLSISVCKKVRTHLTNVMNLAINSPAKPTDLEEGLQGQQNQ